MSLASKRRLRALVASRAGGVCEYCLIHEDDTFFGCEVDHIVSRKHGGLSHPDNLAYACLCCNRYKGSDIASLATGGQALFACSTRGSTAGENTSASIVEAA